MRLANLSSGISDGEGRTFELSELFDLAISVPATQPTPPAIGGIGSGGSGGGGGGWTDQSRFYREPNRKAPRRKKPLAEAEPNTEEDTLLAQALAEDDEFGAALFLFLNN